MSVLDAPLWAWLTAAGPLVAFGGACVPEQPRARDAGALQAMDLLESLRAEGYHAWPRPEPWSERSEASGSHGRFVDLFVSPEAAIAIDSEDEVARWPARSRFVVEGYERADAGAPYVVSVMLRDGAGWIWAQYEDDEPVVYGRPSACSGCHTAGDDFVRSFALP